MNMTDEAKKNIFTAKLFGRYIRKKRNKSAIRVINHDTIVVINPIIVPLNFDHIKIALCKSKEMF